MSISEDLAKIDLVRSHIENVQRYTYRLGCKLIEQGNVELGRNLIANGQIHDNSKFKGIEFEHLFYGDPLLEDVRKHHVALNPHHPEHWGNIKEMPSVYIAEMVCDWYARSNEFGSDFRGWITYQATARFGFTIKDPLYKQIMEFVDLLLGNPFKVNTATLES
jgi:hypothetical protein